VDPGTEPLPSFDPGEYGSFDPGEFSFPPPQATFTKGTASVTIDGVKIALDQMPSPGTLMEEIGLEATWTDGKGLYLRFFGTPAIGNGKPDGFVSLDRIQDGKHWTTADPSGCKVTITKGDATGIAGSATCTDLRWADTMAGLNGPAMPFVEGEPAFDVAATFEATP
jgi:hypothetical protein